MRGYPQFSFWILIALAKICFFHIVINRANRCISRLNPNIADQTRDTQNLRKVTKGGTVLKGKKLSDVAALTRSSLICWENNTPNNKTMDPSPENNRAAWYQGPMKLEVVESCGATQKVCLLKCHGYQTRFLRARTPLVPRVLLKRSVWRFW